MQAPTTLIIGGAGKTGRRVAERLAARDLPFRLASRSGEVRFDWDDRSTWAPALRGAEQAYITFYPDVAVPGAADAIGALARTAVEQGARRLVLLSGRGEEEAQRAEQELAAAGAEWTVARCSWFMQNFDESYWHDPLLDGTLALPAGDRAAPFVHADDIADVVTAALTEDGHAGEVYELTGPQTLTFAEAVAEIGRAAGRDLRYLPIGREEYTAGAQAEGVPADIVELLDYLFSEVLVEENASVADGVQRALGRPPRDFASFAREAVAAGAWATVKAA